MKLFSLYYFSLNSHNRPCVVRSGFVENYNNLQSVNCHARVLVILCGRGWCEEVGLDANQH
jgi:hypothetical protein